MYFELTRRLKAVESLKHHAVTDCVHLDDPTTLLRRDHKLTEVYLDNGCGSKRVLQNFTFGVGKHQYHDVHSQFTILCKLSRSCSQPAAGQPDGPD